MYDIVDLSGLRERTPMQTGSKPEYNHFMKEVRLSGPAWCAPPRGGGGGGGGVWGSECRLKINKASGGNITQQVLGVAAGQKGGGGGLPPCMRI